MHVTTSTVDGEAVAPTDGDCLTRLDPSCAERVVAEVRLADTDHDLAEQGTLFSGLGMAGQRCTALGTVIVHHDVHDAFMARFTAVVEAAVVGDPRREDVLFGPMINERFADDFLGWFDHVEGHHEVSGSSATGRITASEPRLGLAGARVPARRPRR